MKKFIDIEAARFEDDEFKTSNTGAFFKGDVIQVSEKIDGSNSSIHWDREQGGLIACSRKQVLTFKNTLNGFWNYMMSLPIETVCVFSAHPEWVVYGEWGLNGNKIKTYPEELRHTWIVYDIYNPVIQNYMPQEYVKKFCEKANLTYIHALYEGEFISWEHIKTFLHANSYGDTQEGVVVKNQSRLWDDTIRQPKYLKIVNDSFKERMVTKVKKEKSADELEEEARVQTIIDAIITPARVEKGIYKLRDEGILPEKLTPADMKLVAQNLPRYIYQDCLKEEPEMVQSGGELFNKRCGSAVMKIAREFICGG